MSKEPRKEENNEENKTSKNNLTAMTIDSSDRKQSKLSI